jgi:hypothetical protein
MCDQLVELLKSSSCHLKRGQQCIETQGRNQYHESWNSMVDCYWSMLWDNDLLLKYQQERLVRYR